MDSYLIGNYKNENEAKEAIEEIVKEHTNDYAIYIRARKTKSAIIRRVTFALVLQAYSDNNALLYNLFMKKYRSMESFLYVIGSDTFVDNQKKKEYFFIDAEIEVNE